MRRCLRLAVAVVSIMMVSGCGGSTSPTGEPASPGSVSDSSSSSSRAAESPSASPSRTPVSTTEWVINSDTDPTVAEGLSVAITFPATAADFDLIGPAIEAREGAGLSEGTWLVASVRNDSDEATWIGTAEVVTGDRQQVELESGVMMLNAVSEADPETYAEVSDLNSEFADLQGSNIKPGTDATVILGTEDEISGGVVALYLKVGGFEIEALPPGQVAPAAAPAVLDGDLPEDPSAEQVAAALGCETFKGRKPKREDVGPSAVSEGSCKMAGTSYGIWVYASEGDVAAWLVLAEGIAEGFGYAFEMGYAQRWVVTANDETLLGQEMKGAVDSLGGEVVLIGDVTTGE